MTFILSDHLINDDQLNDKISLIKDSREYLRRGGGGRLGGGDNFNK